MAQLYQEADGFPAEIKEAVESIVVAHWPQAAQDPQSPLDWAA